MIGNHHVLAIIPARGRSRRFPRKNVREFLGTPLVARAIEQAQSCRYVDRVICSTEDPEVNRIARACGCEVQPRPWVLASDQATMNEVLGHILGANSGYDLALVLQPTSPLRSILDVEMGISLGMSISVGPSGAPNGAVYVVETARFKCYPYFGGQVFYMPAERSIDIDTEADWKKAEEYGRQG